MTTHKLDGRVALVTGAGQGIGRAIAIKLASEGAKVVANDLDGHAVEIVARAITEAGGTCSALQGDVTDENFGDMAVAETLERYGDLGILINNAGYIWNSRIINHTDEQWYAMMDVHATGPFRLLRAAGRYFRDASKKGDTEKARKVVNISSISGLYGEATQFSYSAAKTTLIGMTRSLSKDWGRYNVTVNCVAFGYIETRLTQGYDGTPPEIEVGGRSHKVGLKDNIKELVTTLIPLGRAGTVEDAAGAVYLFCTPESDFISGEIIVASGGQRS